nr:putative ribonuclease H-like domain-containing protein [Tanacetum cinerariifolium]
MSDHEDETIPEENAHPKVVPQITTVTNIFAKFPYLKKGEYDIWAMKMQNFISSSDLLCRNIVLKGNSAKSMTTDNDGNLKIHPPVTAEEYQQVQREENAQTILLSSLPDEHMGDFYHMINARDIWNAIKARFGRNAESKKMQKSLLKQKFEEFKISEEEGLDKGYDKMQKILTQMNTLKIKPDPEDDPVKAISLTKNREMMDLDQMNKEEFEEYDLKHQMAMLSIKLVKCFNCKQMGHFSRECRAQGGQNSNNYQKYKSKEAGKDGTDSKDMVVVDGSIDWDKQIEEGNTEPKSLENFGMIAGIKIESDADSKGKVVSADDAIPAGVSVSAGTVVGPQSETECAFMGLSTEVSIPVTCPLCCDSKYKLIEKDYQGQREQLNDCVVDLKAHKNAVKILEKQIKCHQKNQLAYEEKIRVLSYELEEKSNILEYRQKLINQAAQEKQELMSKLDNEIANQAKWNNSGRNLYKLIDSSMSVRTKRGLGLDKYIREGELGIDDSKVSIFHTNSDDLEGQPIYNRFALVDHMKAVPPPLTGNYMPPSNIPDIDESQMAHRVLFTENECLVLSKDFPLPNPSMVILSILRKHNLYTISLNELAPKGPLTCLIAKASQNDSTLWHRRLGYVNFRNMNKLVKGNLVRGLPSKLGLAFPSLNPILGVGSTLIGSSGSAGSTPLVSAGSTPPMSPCASPISVDRHFISAGKPSGSAARSPVPAGHILGKLTSNTSSERFPRASSVENSDIHDGLKIFDCPKTGIFTSSSYDEDFSGPDANNLENYLNVSSTITKQIHSIHPTSQVLGDINSPVQTRSQVKHKGSSKSAFISYIYDQRRNNHTDFQLCMFSCFLSQEEPTTMAQAFADPDWVEAMQAEMQQFKNQKEEGIDYTGVFAPVAIIEAIGLFLTFASFIGFMVYQMDIKSAFLYGKIAEEVYVTQPRGFEDPDHPKKVYKVVKALYGLHHAPRAWYERLSTFLLKHGYRRGTIDKTLFIKKNSKDIMLVQVYVDDIIFGSTRKNWCEEFETLMQSEFEMSSMGPLTFFLGLQVDQRPDGIFIHQEKYVADILKKFDLDNSKLASTPFEPQKIREKNVPDEPIN